MTLLAISVYDECYIPCVQRNINTYVVNYKADNDEDKTLQLVRVRTSCMDLHVTDTVMDVIPGEHQLTRNMFGNNWIPEDFVDEDGNLTIDFRVVGKAEMMKT